MVPESACPPEAAQYTDQTSGVKGRGRYVFNGT